MAMALPPLRQFTLSVGRFQRRDGSCAVPKSAHTHPGGEMKLPGSKLRFAALALSGVAVAALGGAPASATPFAATSSQPGAGDDGDTRRVRAEFGLSTTSEARNSARSEGRAPHLLGIPLTAAEESRIQRQDVIAQAAAHYTAEQEDRPGFAGAWLDRAAGDVVRVAAVRDGETFRGEIRRRLPGGTQVELVTASRSVSELDNQYERVEAEAARMVEDGLPVQGVGRSLASNTTVVRVSADSTDEQVAEVQRRAPDALIVREGEALRPALRRTDMGGHPVYGGSLVRQTNGGTCTANVSFTNSSVRYILTAGHCGSDVYWWGKNPTYPDIPSEARRLNAGVGNRWILDGRTIDCDCVGIPAPDNLIGFTSTRVLVGGSHDTDQPAPFAYNRTGTGGDYGETLRVCKTGYITGLTCGTITQNPSSYVYQESSTRWITVRGIYSNNTAASRGDSGGAVGRDGNWLGLTSGVGGTSFLFTRADAMLANLNASVDYSR